MKPMLGNPAKMRAVEVFCSGTPVKERYPEKVPVGAEKSPDEVAKVKLKEEETWVAVSKRAMPFTVPFAAAPVDVTYRFPLASFATGMTA